MKKGKKNTDKSHQYFDRFKLYLHKNTSNKLPPLPPHQTALSVIADYLQCLCITVYDDIQSIWGGIVTKDDIVWYLTVPAMWSGKAKQDMRQAAVMAKMVSFFSVEIYFHMDH